MEVNLLLVFVIAIIMGALWGIFDAIRVKTVTGMWDVGYVVAVLIYSVLVGILAAYTGLLNISMPFSEWWTVLVAQMGLYTIYLQTFHIVCDYFIAMIFPETKPQGLATIFIRQPGLMQLKRR